LAGVWLTQAPWCAVSNDLDAESGNRAKVVVYMGVVATLFELVLSIGNSIGKYQRIGPFLTDGPRKVREFDSVNNRVQHRVANLAEPHIHLAPRTNIPVGYDPDGLS
jgi:hypothetical protein